MNNLQLSTLLVSDPKAFNEYREKHPTQPINLSGMYFNGAHICNANLSGVDLSYCLASGVSFSMCDLSGANFKGSCLTYSAIRNCKIGAADFTDASLRVSVIRGSDFSRAILNNTNMDKVDSINLLND